jgi:hypothetical protein
LFSSSAHPGSSNSASGDPFSQLSSLEPFVLVDDCDRVWSALNVTINKEEEEEEEDVVDIVMDNAGFELVSDLCLAEYIVKAKLAKKVSFCCRAFINYRVVCLSDGQFLFGRRMLQYPINADSMPLTH